MAEECGFISCKDRKTGCIVINNSRFLWGLCRKLHKHIVILNLEVDLANSALLVLEDGSVFKGTAIGATGSAVGEVVFTTSAGYQQFSPTHPTLNNSSPYLSTHWQHRH